MGDYPNWDEEALRGYCEGCAENFSWMTDVLGADPEAVCPPATEEDAQNPAYLSGTEKIPSVPGYRGQLYMENPWGLGRPGLVTYWAEFPEIPESLSCYMLKPVDTKAAPCYYQLLVSAISARVDDDRLTLWKGCPGKRLIVDQDNAVIGVVVEKDGAELNVKANGGVCLCTGGFESDELMVANYLQQPHIERRAGFLNTGDGVKMAAGVGAELWHMSNTAGFYVAYKHPELQGCTVIKKNVGIYAGKSGARYTNETSEVRHGRINIGGRWYMEPISLPSYYVLDSTMLEKPLVDGFSEGNAHETESGLLISADTIEELSQKIRDLGKAPDFNANGELDAALASYNAHCHANDGAGEPDDFGRMCTQPIETGPFYAYEIVATVTNTQGGPRRNQHAQVVAADGYPIQGLFSGGELGSIFCDMYNGGGNLGETMVFGRLAGQNAARRARGEFEGATEKAVAHGEKLAAAEVPDETPTVDVASTPDGTYEGSGQGYASRIRVSVTVEGGAMTAVDILESNESAEYGTVVLPNYAAAIVDTQDLDAVDAGSGASTTLKGLQLAVKNALLSARGE